MTWLTAMEYLCQKWPRICFTCRKHFPVLSSSMTYHGFVTRLTRWVSLVEQELPTLPEYMSSSLIPSGVRVTRSLVLFVCFVDRCLSFSTCLWPLPCLFFFDKRILITSLIPPNSSSYIRTYFTVNYSNEFT
jgi:hypothetical protein